MNTTYPSDLTDAKWARLHRHLPAGLPRRRWPRHSLRKILDAVFSLLRTGCPWRSLPRDFPLWQTVYYHFRRFRLDGTWHHLLTSLRQAERMRVDRNMQQSAAMMDAQSVKSVEELASMSGYDGHKRVKGRKRHLLVDTLGLPISLSVTSAGIHDKVGAGRLLAGLKPLVPRLEKIWADGAYTSRTLARWCKEYGGWEVAIVGRDPEAQGFAVQPRRWVVEGTFAWLVRNRGLRIDYERKVQTSETLIEVAMICLILRRLARTT